MSSPLSHQRTRLPSAFQSLPVMSNSSRLLFRKSLFAKKKKKKQIGGAPV